MFGPEGEGLEVLALQRVEQEIAGVRNLDDDGAVRRQPRCYLLQHLDRPLQMLQHVEQRHHVEAAGGEGLDRFFHANACGAQGVLLAAIELDAGAVARDGLRIAQEQAGTGSEIADPLAGDHDPELLEPPQRIGRRRRDDLGAADARARCGAVVVGLPLAVVAVEIGRRGVEEDDAGVTALHHRNIGAVPRARKELLDVLADQPVTLQVLAHLQAVRRRSATSAARSKLWRPSGGSSSSNVVTSPAAS